MKRAPAVPRVVQRLFAEHRYLGALVQVLTTKSSTHHRARVGDLYLLRDVVAYLQDYPDHVHHPTEELLFARVLLHKPALQGLVARLRRDHDELAQENRRVLALLDEALDRPREARARAALDGCHALARRQREHMQVENTEAFPAALATLSRADWHRIEARFRAADDPLFGQVVSSRHRRLYEYLLDFADRREGRGPDWLSAARLKRAGALMSAGGEDCWRRVAGLGGAVIAASGSALRQSLQPASLTAAITLPASYGWQIGRSVSDCGADLLAIWAATARRMLELYGLPGKSARPG